MHMSFLGRLFRRCPAPLWRRGEQFAATWLRRQGYRILERNLPLADDEADLIALDPDGRTVVIVEVKTRADDTTAPEASISRTKQYRLSRLAARLLQSRQYQDRPLRFDAISIVWPDGAKRPTVRHIPAAFESPW